MEHLLCPRRRLDTLPGEQCTTSAPCARSANCDRILLVPEEPPFASRYEHLARELPPTASLSCTARAAALRWYQYRSRRAGRKHGQSQARTDPSDAWLIADILRTDQPRLTPWYPDSLLTRQMRAKVSLILHLTHQSTRLSNRLRAVLLRYYPAATQVFSSLQAQIALQFIRTYPTPQGAATLTWADFQVFAQQHGHRQPKKLPACFARLQGDFPHASAETVLVYQDEAAQLADLLLVTVLAKNEALRTLQALFQQHPDRPIFASLPGAGDLLAPALLTKFGDDRRRFPAPASVQALAGTCPVTEQSGKRKRVYFRRACDREFRHIAQQWAITSLDESAWANTYWHAVRPHCRSDSHAHRCLANRWLAIAWKLWQSHTPYDEDYHLRQRAEHSKPRR